MATRGGDVSKSATKALRAGIGREGKRGISTFLLARSGSIGVFVADLDNPSPRTGRGRVVVRLGEVHDVGVGVGTGEAGDRPPRPARGALPATALNSRLDQIHAAPTALTRTRGMLGARETVDARGQDRG